MSFVSRLQEVPVSAMETAVSDGVIESAAVEAPAVSMMEVGVEVCVVLGVVLVTMLASGPLVGHFTRPNPALDSKPDDDETVASPATDDTQSAAKSTAMDTGSIVGKCENILVVLMVLANAMTGLALIFTAKTFVRKEKIETDPRYYLVGTMVNVTFSIVMGFLARSALVLLRETGQIFP